MNISNGASLFFKLFKLIVATLNRKKLFTELNEMFTAPITCDLSEEGRFSLTASPSCLQNSHEQKGRVHYPLLQGVKERHSVGRQDQVGIGESWQRPLEKSQEQQKSSFRSHSGEP